MVEQCSKGLSGSVKSRNFDFATTTCSGILRPLQHLEAVECMHGESIWNASAGAFGLWALFSTTDVEYTWDILYSHFQIQKALGVSVIKGQS